MPMEGTLKKWSFLGPGTDNLGLGGPTFDGAGSTRRR
jgi:hypothetical protein